MCGSKRATELSKFVTLLISDGQLLKNHLDWPRKKTQNATLALGVASPLAAEAQLAGVRRELVKLPHIHNASTSKPLRHGGHPWPPCGNDGMPTELVQ